MIEELMTDKVFRDGFLSNAKLPEPINGTDLLAEYKITREKTIIDAKNLGVGLRGINEIKSKTAESFLRRWMMILYASVDLSFTQRKWYIQIERNENNIFQITNGYSSPVDIGGDTPMKILSEINRFFKIDYRLSEFAFGEHSTEKRASQNAGNIALSRKNHLPYTSLRVSAALPDGINHKHVRIAQQAMGHYHLARSLCYTAGIDIAGDLQIENSYSSQTINVIWGPNIDVLSVTAVPPRPAGDPAIILSLSNQNYLLDFYDTPDETPIVNLIREFSEGKLPKTRKKR